MGFLVCWKEKTGPQLSHEPLCLAPVWSHYSSLALLPHTMSEEGWLLWITTRQETEESSQMRSSFLCIHSGRKCIHVYWHLHSPTKPGNNSLLSLACTVHRAQCWPADQLLFVSKPVLSTEPEWQEVNTVSLLERLLILWFGWKSTNVFLQSSLKPKLLNTQLQISKKPMWFLFLLLQLQSLFRTHAIRSAYNQMRYHIFTWERACNSE